MAAKGLIVLAIGGNSLIRDAAHKTVQDQWEACRQTCRRIAGMIEAGYTVVVTHGNGPQVGFIVRRSELSRHELHEVPLDSCGADTQGAIGYMIQLCLANEFRRRGLARTAVSVVTQVEVDAADPAFRAPSKPIGSFMDEATARARATAEGWSIAEDAGRGWRRVVPSPRPRAIVELGAIRVLVEQGFAVTAVGGGGIPVVRGADGDLQGVEAVIDKDYASALLAAELKADLFVISTGVERVCLNFGKPNQQELARLGPAEARRHLEAGQFAAGSMRPKIEAILDFLARGGRRALLTLPEKLEEALAGRAGTLVEAGA